MKRFGRNQKRKLKQEAQNCREALVRDQAILNRQSARLRELESAVGQIYYELGRELGQYHPMLPLQKAQTSGDSLRVTEAPKFDLDPRASIRAVEPMRLTDIILDLMRMDVNFDKMRNQMAVRISHPDGTAMYACTLDAFRFANFREDLAQNAARRIAHELVDFMTKKHGGVL